MHISIIGGSGFIGTRLCGRITKKINADFSIVDKSPSAVFPDKYKRADVRLVEELRLAITKGTVIVNLAAEHRDDVKPLSLYDEVNVAGAKNICAVARERNVSTIVFTSSVAVYGFAPIGTDESGTISPFNDYGRTKFEAEQIFKAWQSEDSLNRTLVIVRPTVIFGEQNRGNVFNLLRQIASGLFVMVGDGQNRKSMAYVENVAAFLEYCLSFKPGVHIYNYIDKPDFDMNSLVRAINRMLGKSDRISFRLPYAVGLIVAKAFDLMAVVTSKRFPVSAIRVKKFCANSVYETALRNLDFVAPWSLTQALEKTVRHEFLESHEHEKLFYSE